jgi:DNA polymerase delta subunit 1
VFSQLLRKARQRGFILPFMKVGGQGAGQDGVAYEGATVLEPKIGEHVSSLIQLVVQF